MVNVVVDRIVLANVAGKVETVETVDAVDVIEVDIAVDVIDTTDAPDVIDSVDATDVIETGDSIATESIAAIEVIDAQGVVDAFVMVENVDSVTGMGSILVGTIGPIQEVAPTDETEAERVCASSSCVSTSDPSEKLDTLGILSKLCILGTRCKAEILVMLDTSRKRDAFGTPDKLDRFGVLDVFNSRRDPFKAIKPLFIPCSIHRLFINFLFVPTCPHNPLVGGLVVLDFSTCLVAVVTFAALFDFVSFCSCGFCNCFGDGFCSGFCS